MDPIGPVPAIIDGWLLRDLPAAAIDALIQTVGPGSGSPLLSVELRHLGGRLADAAPGHGALASLEAGFATATYSVVPDTDRAIAVGRHAAMLRSSLAPWEAERNYPNFAERRSTWPTSSRPQTASDSAESRPSTTRRTSSCRHTRSLSIDIWTSSPATRWRSSSGATQKSLSRQAEPRFSGGSATLHIVATCTRSESAGTAASAWRSGRSSSSHPSGWTGGLAATPGDESRGHPRSFTPPAQSRTDEEAQRAAAVSWRPRTGSGARKTKCWTRSRGTRWRS